ncbi:transposase [Candidatus Zixiibacteriota bacterium]
MSSRIRNFAPGHYCHIFNRGINEQNIFFSGENYLYYLRLLGQYTDRYLATVIAYCLMPNHYHLLLRQDGEVSLSKLMQVQSNAYVQGINKQLGRKGTLFEGRFKHVHVDKDEYFLHLCRYIHLNPVKANLVQKPEKWLFSNYLEWIGKRQDKLKDIELISSFFPTPEDYKRFVMELSIEEKLKRKLQPYLLE